ncbi:unnamed protein product [Calicophoron daubneyi]|uniref:Uncharacterized protein n=1 Tax=Calicophoron daubneyi TaxID=300641 RepID=A0AAV2TZM6_CALDB
MAQHRPLKIVVVGDGAVGKTCMLITYVEGRFPAEYVPTVFENYSGSVMVDGEIVPFELWDTAGQEEYSHLRPLTYAGTDLVILCFSIANEASFKNVEDKWVPELTTHVPRAPILLVGCKLDIRKDVEVPGLLSFVTYAQGSALARRIKAKGYLECSALTNEGVKEVFDQSIRHLLAKNQRRTKRHKCCLL